MAWDSSRPVPWLRLIREWLIYLGIAVIAFVGFSVIKGDGVDLALLAGLLVSGPMYVFFGALMAKFGYVRKTFKELRSERTTAASTASAAAAANAANGPRSKPAPTRRTTTGPSQHRPSSKPKRR